MAHPSIVDISELTTRLGIAANATDADLALLEQLRGEVEDDCRAYVRHNITQPASNYVEYHPRTERRVFGDEFIEVSGNVVSIQRASEEGKVIQLDQMYARTSGIEVREDFDAYFGQDASDFGADTVLTSGTDYFLITEEDGISRAGLLWRRTGPWPARPGTVKVSYTAGFSASELDRTYRDIKRAVLNEIVRAFQQEKSKQNTKVGAGAVKSFSIGGQFSVTFEGGASYAGLSSDTKRRLDRYRRLV